MHASVRYSFGGFVLDVAERSLARCSPTASSDSQSARVSLQPKTFDLLVYLVTNAGRLHTKQALLDEVWGTVVVTENSLTRSISQLRTALDDTADEPRFVETVPRVGYRFIAPVTQEQPSTASPEPPAVLPAPPAHSRRVFVYAFVALLGIAAAYFAVDRYGFQHTPSAQRMRSVAVLPFKNIGNDPGNEVLADGIPDTLLTMLAQIQELRVIGRTSSFSFRDKDIDLRAIGDALGAGAVLEGSVQRNGDRIRINAQLVSANDGMHLWAENFERPITDIFAIQDEIAGQVAEALHITLAGREGPGSVGTQNFEAYELFLESARMMQGRKVADIPVMIEKLQRALELDPRYASAWGLLALAYESDSAPDAAEKAARRAIELAPDSAGGHFALGNILMDAGADGAAQELARALELGPNDPWAISGVANEYRRVAGRYAEAAALMRRAVSLDPRNHDIRLQAAFAFEANDDRPGALAEVHEVLRLQPEMAFAYHAAGEMQWGVLGRMDDALRFMRRARALEPEAAHDALVTGYALLGEDAQAQRELASIRPLLDADEFLILRARIDVLAGRDTAARELLERALTVDPPSERLLVNAAKLGLTVAPEAARHALDRLRVVDPDFIVHASPYQQDAVVCTLAWSGDHDGAASVLMRSEKRIRGQPLYTLATDDRRAWLARALACAGRGEEAIVELEQVVAAKYHAGGSRGLAADHAFDAIRDDPRFKELIAQLRSVEDAERQRYLARPDLEDADVEALARTTSR